MRDQILHCVVAFILHRALHKNDLDNGYCWLDVGGEDRGNAQWQHKGKWTNVEMTEESFFAGNWLVREGNRVASARLLLA